jgi:hypothetical protein
MCFNGNVGNSLEIMEIIKLNFHHFQIISIISIENPKSKIQSQKSRK